MILCLLNKHHFNAYSYLFHRPFVAKELGLKVRESAFLIEKELSIDV